MSGYTHAIGVRDKDATIASFGRHVSSGKARFFQSAGIDFVMGRREGPYIWDVGSQVRLIDCHCNGGVYNLGHRNPELIRVLVESLDELDIGNHHLISEPRAALAEQLAGLTPGHLAYTVFAVAGGEAVDLAIKIARGFTGRSKVISARGGYHGCTGLALAAGDAKFRAAFGSPLPGFAQVPFGDADALAAAVDEETAAVILETIPATAGMPIPAADYFPAVRALCDRAGALLIIDEVQAGLGRTGRLWGIEHYGVAPDILVIGKGLSGGVYPMAATCFSAALEAVFHPDPFVHISTFGGAEAGCPVARRVLEISSAPAFLAHVVGLADLFAVGFRKLQVAPSRRARGPAAEGADDGHRAGPRRVWAAVHQSGLRSRRAFDLCGQLPTGGAAFAAAEHRSVAGRRDHRARGWRAGAIEADVRAIAGVVRVVRGCNSPAQVEKRPQPPECQPLRGLFSLRQ